MEQSAKSQKLTVEEAFAVAMEFFIKLWDLIESNWPSDSDEYIHHEIFCRALCLGRNTFPEWNEAVYRVTKFEKDAQPDIMLTSDEVISCMIAFCEFCNERYDSNVGFIASLLKSMQSHPKEHPNEWKLFLSLIQSLKAGELIVEFDWEITFEDNL